jgi:hypothetical protein
LKIEIGGIAGTFFLGQPGKRTPAEIWEFGQEILITYGLKEQLTASFTKKAIQN